MENISTIEINGSAYNIKASSIEKKVFNNISLTADAWVSDSTYLSYPYRAFITCSGITSDDYAYVTFNPDNSDLDALGKINDTATNGVYIYAAEKPSSTVNILSIVCI